MGLKDALRTAWEGAKARNDGEDAAKEWYRQGNTTPPGDNTISGLASEVAPGYEEQFIEGFDDRWNEGAEAQDMNVWQRFWQSKAPL